VNGTRAYGIALGNSTVCKDRCSRYKASVSDVHLSPLELDVGFDSISTNICFKRVTIEDDEL
jgi:hypothetical protein